MSPRENYNGTEDDYEDYGEEDWKDEEGEEQSQQQPSFPEFCAHIQQVLRTFGGQMFCKLNWSSPKGGSTLLY